MTTLPARSEGPSRSARAVSVLLVLVGAALWLALFVGTSVAAARFVEIYRKFKIPDLPMATKITCGAGLFAREYWFLFAPVWFAAMIALARKAARVASNVFDRWPTTFALVSFLCVFLMSAFVIMSLWMPLVITIEVFGQ